jgi:acylphosphatase
MTTTTRRRVLIQVAGRVQGVFFRASTRDKAENLGLTGWVRNLPNGDVELLAEGEPGAFAQLLAWCHTGPRLARVDTCRISYQTPTGEFDRFSVLRDE